jgi:uncharacterized protein YndB with AHSA1/START domain
MTSSEQAQVIQDVVLEAEVELVWELLTRPDDQAAWLGADVELTASPGAPGRVVDRDGTVRHLVVEEAEPGRRLSWTWWTDGQDAVTSRVEITIDGSSDRTRLRVVEMPITGSTTPSLHARAGSAWASRLLDLEVLLLFAAAAIRA